MTEAEIKRRFRLALLGYVILAAACLAGIAYNYSQQKELKKHQEAILTQVQQIQSNQEAILKLTRNTAAAFCLLALAPTHTAAVDLIAQFNRTGVITLPQHSPCYKTVAQAERLVIK